MVIQTFHANQQADESVPSIYQSAVEKTRRHFGVTYQTIGDLCRRRLNLQDIDDFYRLLGGWVGGDPMPLAQLLKEHTPQSYHKEIDLALGLSTAAGSAPRNDLAIAAKTESAMETFCFHLSKEQSHKIKALAEIEGLSIGEWLSSNVADLVTLGIQNWLRKEVKQMKAEDRDIFFSKIVAGTDKPKP